MSVPPCAHACPVVELLTIDIARRGQPENITRLAAGIDKPPAVSRPAQGDYDPPIYPTIPPPCDDGDYLTGHQEQT